MRREQLEHIIRACGAILNEDDIIIVGSQAILGQFPTNLPAAATESIEADILPLCDPDGRKADIVTGAIGEDSFFHSTFGIWAHGVDLTTCTLPDGWRNRLIPLRNQNTRGVTGHCLDVHDLLISKYIAGREKDLVFCSALVEAGLVNREILLERLHATDCSSQQRKRVETQIKSHFSHRQQQHKGKISTRPRL